MHVIRDYTYLRQQIVPGGIGLFLAVSPQQFVCPAARPAFGKREPKTDAFALDLSDANTPPLSLKFSEPIAAIAALFGKSRLPSPKNIDDLLDSSNDMSNEQLHRSANNAKSAKFVITFVTLPTTFLVLPRRVLHRKKLLPRRRDRSSL